MTTESKILTVSYGTFSCTLEGFENPFDTMKAIAEYFRDLAAQDRHFGAEPPPPDAAMLHRLAEREVSRLSAAKRDEVARADTASEGEAAEAVAPRIQFNPIARRPARGPVEPEVQAEEDLTGPEPSLQDVIPDGVAAKLARIRRAVHPMAADLSAPASTFVAETLDEAAEDAAAAFAPTGTEAETDFDLAAEDLAPDLPEAEIPDVAARLGALIADDEVPAAETYFDETAAEATDTAGNWYDSIEADAIDAAEAHVEDVLPVADPEVETVEESAIEMDARVEADAAREDLSDLAALDGVTLDEAARAAALDDALPEDALPEDSPAEMGLAELTLAEAEAIDPVAEAMTDADPDTDFVAPEAEAEVAEAPQPMTKSGRSRRMSSRVVQLHPGEDTAARDPGATRVLSRPHESDEIARLMQQAEDVMAEDANRRRQEALSHLKAAVVSTEADRADIDYEAPRADISLDPYRDDLAEAIQPDEPEAPLAPPEVKPRRKSVQVRTQELRPGTIRPGMISPPPLVLVSEQRIDRVVPAAPPAAAPSMAPAMPGIAPANPSGQPMVALRTGRLSGAIGSGAAIAASAAPARNIVLEKPSYGTAAEADDDEDLAEDSRDIDESGLAAFAETVGARSMAEMLEAAAAFATCVEKREQFTRPQLMRRMMASAGGKPVSREDGLRSFGTLLRTGRIEKVTRGHYALADNSPYLAEARRLS
ncbi:MAG: lipoprotein [Rhodobacteraceae bacterium]|nr:MAG: lipoprotein [Paracoccaceae bacterium]